MSKPWSKEWLDEMSEFERRPCKVHWIVLAAVVIAVTVLVLWNGTNNLEWPDPNMSPRQAQDSTPTP